MKLERAYRILGMTCEHCERSVSEAVQGVPGVDSASADRCGEMVVVRGEGFEDGEVAAAVRSAGYELAAR